jgi:hypothetical protein
MGKKPFSKAAASEGRDAPSGYVKGLNDAITPLPWLPSLLCRNSFGYEGRELWHKHGFFSILLRFN